MSGELRTSQFRWTTTADNDFVIGNPGVSSTDTKFLVFQTNTDPTPTAQPSISCVHSGGSPGNWTVKTVSTTGGIAVESDLVGMAYLAGTGPQVFSGNNTFSGNLILGATSGNSLTVNATTSFTNDVTINGTLNVAGVINHTVTTNLDVVDKTITLNKGGGASSGGSSGIDIEENGSVSGYLSVNAARTGWDLKAPATAGIITFVPTATTVALTMPTSTGTLALTSDISTAISGVHAAVTLGTANGLGLSGQQLSLGVASAGVTGALSGTDWSTFNGVTTKATDSLVVHLAGSEVITGAKEIKADLTLTSYNSGNGGSWTSKVILNHTSAGGSLDTGTVTFWNNSLYNLNSTGPGAPTSSNYNIFLQTSSHVDLLSGLFLTRNTSSNKTILELAAESGGSEIILKDTDGSGTRYVLYVNAGVLHLALYV